MNRLLRFTSIARNLSIARSPFIQSATRCLHTLPKSNTSSLTKIALFSTITVGTVATFAFINNTNASECHDPICAENMNLFKKSLDATASMNPSQPKEHKPSPESSDPKPSAAPKERRYKEDCEVDRPNEFTVYDPNTQTYYECPPDRRLLGRHSWTLLHSIAAYYPEHPTEEDKQNAITFLNSFAQLYPCKQCAHHFQKLLVDMPPRVDSQKEFVIWMAEAHNVVSKKCHKRLYPEDYETLQKRWRTGCDICYHPPEAEEKEVYTSEQTMNCEDLAKYYKNKQQQ